MMPYPFDCPKCGQRYWREESVVYNENYDDTICWRCDEEEDDES